MVVRTNKRRLTPIFICPYCGCFTPRLHHRQVYCHKSIKQCSKYAQMEYHNEYEKLQRKKQKENLGGSDLREHKKDSFADELKAIMKEKSKIKNIDINFYKKQIEKLKENEEYV